MFELFDSVLTHDQEVDFVAVKKPSDKYEKEAKKLRIFSEELWNLLAENGCWIGGGAITSVFTNKPINDIDVYFPNKEAFSNVMAHVYGVSWNGGGDLSFRNCIVQHVTNKSILITSDEEKVQFIVFRFFESVQDIFDSFDFTAVMGAFNMKDEEFILHPDFLKHNAQRFLSFNKGTAYPLISMLRVDKYRERGYTTSKQEMLKIGFAINAKNFDSWEKAIDEVGSMYGLDPEKVFDTTKPFSIDEVITQLDNLLIPVKFINTNPVHDFFKLAKLMPEKLTPEVLEYVEKYKGVEYYQRPSFLGWLEEKEKSVQLPPAQAGEIAIPAPIGITPSVSVEIKRPKPLLNWP